MKHLSIKIEEPTEKKLKEIRELRGRSISDNICLGIDMLHDSLMKKKFGYKGYDKTQSKSKGDMRAEKIAELKAMPDTDLTKYLQGIGFIDPDAVDPDSPTKEKIWRMETKADGNRFVVLRYIDRKTGNTTFSQDCWSIDELIQRLIKQNLLL